MYYYQIILHANPWEIYLHDGAGKQTLKEIKGERLLAHKKLISVGDEELCEQTMLGDRKECRYIELEIIDEEGNSKNYEARDLRIEKRKGERFTLADLKQKIDENTTLLWVIDHQRDGWIRFDVELEEKFDIDKLSFAVCDFFADDTTFPYDNHFIDGERIFYDGVEQTWSASKDIHNFIEVDLFDWCSGREGDMLIDSDTDIITDEELDHIYENLMPPRAV